MGTSLGQKKVALIFGGRSSEHSVSCITARSVLKHIDPQRWEVLPIGISKQGKWTLISDMSILDNPCDGGLPQVPDSPQNLDILALLHSCDVVFPLLHGPYGEDGTLQGMLDLADIKYVGCGVTSSAIMMDKGFMRTIFAAQGLPQTPWVTVTARQWKYQKDQILDSIKQLQLPVFVKPCRAGSSMGVTKVDAWEQLDAAITLAQEHDPKIIVEQGVLQAREIECGVLESLNGALPKVSLVGEIQANAQFYDFDAKYLSASTQIKSPAEVPEVVAKKLQKMALQAFNAADCEGLARVDFFYTPNGQLLLNEINTMPGFTPGSMYPYVWQQSGLPYGQLIDQLLMLALERPTGLR